MPAFFKILLCLLVLINALNVFAQTKEEERKCYESPSSFLDYRLVEKIFPVYIGKLEQKHEFNIQTETIALEIIPQGFIRVRKDFYLSSLERWKNEMVEGKQQTIEVVVGVEHMKDRALNFVDYQSFQFYIQHKKRQADMIAVNDTEMLCKEKMTAAFIRELQSILRTKGFLGNYPNGSLDAPTQYALEKFQEENKLPQNGLNLLTLDLLGIEY